MEIDGVDIVVIVTILRCSFTVEKKTNKYKTFNRDFFVDQRENIQIAF